MGEDQNGDVPLGAAVIRLGGNVSHVRTRIPVTRQAQAVECRSDVRKFAVMTHIKAEQRRLLLLAGSAEARDLAKRLSEEPTIDLTVSMVRPDRAMEDWPAAVRCGGFNSSKELCGYLKENDFDAVLDATHPFTQRVGQWAVEIAPYARVRRPAWNIAAHPNWTEVPDVAAAADLLAGAERIFVTIGRALLPGLGGIDPARLYVRQLRDGPLPEAFEAATQLIESGPFSVDYEVNLMRKYKIDALFCKNSGGVDSATKLTAAEQLGLPVILLQRPEPPDAPLFETVDAAMTWVRGI